jgi:hypothetical protein
LDDVALPKEVKDFIILIPGNFNPITDALPVYADAAICRLDMPLVFIAGADDETMEADKAAKRITGLTIGASTYTC